MTEIIVRDPGERRDRHHRCKNRLEGTYARNGSLTQCEHGTWWRRGFPASVPPSWHRVPGWWAKWRLR